MLQFRAMAIMSELILVKSTRWCFDASMFTGQQNCFRKGIVMEISHHISHDIGRSASAYRPSMRDTQDEHR